MSGPWPGLCRTAAGQGRARPAGICMHDTCMSVRDQALDAALLVEHPAAGSFRGKRQRTLQCQVGCNLHSTVCKHKCEDGGRHMLPHHCGGRRAWGRRPRRRRGWWGCGGGGAPNVEHILAGLWLLDTSDCRCARLSGCRACDHHLHGINTPVDTPVDTNGAFCSRAHEHAWMCSCTCLPGCHAMGQHCPCARMHASQRSAVMPQQQMETHPGGPGRAEAICAALVKLQQ